MKRRAPFSISKALSALKRGKASDADGLLLPTNIIKKILACLPARECWRIATQLNHAYNRWTKSVVNLYTCHIEEWYPKHTPTFCLFRAQDETQARYKGDFERIQFSYPRVEQGPDHHIDHIDLKYTIKENDVTLEETLLPIGVSSQSRVLYTFEKNVTLSAKIIF